VTELLHSFRILPQQPLSCHTHRKNGDLKVGIYFRRVYATLLHDWLGLPTEPVVGKGVERLTLFRVTVEVARLAYFPSNTRHSLFGKPIPLLSATWRRQR
jgi:hypothetical protein